jgi:ABC-type glutathione transport system ATPase component
MTTATLLAAAPQLNQRDKPIKTSDIAACCLPEVTDSAGDGLVTLSSVAAMRVAFARLRLRRQPHHAMPQTPRLERAGACAAGLAREGNSRGVSFSIRKGEVLGIVGVNKILVFSQSRDIGGTLAA